MAQKTIADISADTLAVIAKLEQTVVNDVISYEALGTVIGLSDVRERRWVLTGAVRQLLRDKQMAFDTVRNVGVKRLDDVAIAHSGPHTIKRIRRMSHRGMQKLACVDDFNALPNEAKVQHNTSMSMLAVLNHFSGPRARKRIETTVVERSSTLPVQRTLELFRKLGK